MFYTIYLDTGSTKGTSEKPRASEIVVEADGYTKKEVRRIYENTHPGIIIKKILINKNFKKKYKEYEEEA
jgi:hypothetical protein